MGGMMLAGGFGTVYRARLDGVQPVAAKMLPAGVTDQKIVDAFMNEVEGSPSSFTGRSLPSSSRATFATC